jgi:putative salt-induced outer membrane protein YdiY
MFGVKHRRAHGLWRAVGVLNVVAAVSGSLAVGSWSAVAQDEGAVALDEVVLKNGSRILGSITSTRDGVVTVETDFAGTLEIGIDQIAGVSTAEPVVLQLSDESVIRDQPLRIDNQQLMVTTGSGAAQAYALDQLLLVNPDPWELGEGYRWTGLLSFALAMQRGNTETDELDFRLESIWRSLEDRYTFRGWGEYDETSGTKSAENWTVIGKYDYFVSDANYWGFNIQAEHDKFADLDLRYRLGPYYGHDFYTKPVFTFSAEAGLSYVNEDFIVAEDRDYPAASWNFHMTSNYLNGESLLYFDQIGLWNLDETSDVIINSTFGLSYPLLWDIEGAAEVVLDYDAGAVEGVDELQQTYRLRIGYRW